MGCKLLGYSHEFDPRPAEQEGAYLSWYGKVAALHEPRSSGRRSSPKKCNRLAKAFFTAGPFVCRCSHQTATSTNCDVDPGRPSPMRLLNEVPARAGREAGCVRSSVALSCTRISTTLSGRLSEEAAPRMAHPLSRQNGLRLLAEDELLVSPSGDFVSLAAKVNAMAVIPQHATYAATLHVAVHAGLPGIDLG